MNFIESIFRLAPDHGNGMFEAAIFLITCVVAIAWTVGRSALKTIKRGLSVAD